MTGRLRLLAALALAGSLLAIRTGIAQGPPPLPAVAPVNQSDDPILKTFRWRSIGPANVGGRIDDIAVVESDPYTYYVGFATGGIWKTTNNGTTWSPIFDSYPTSSIGDIAIAPSNPDIVYVGTGEPNNRQSSSFGDGIYKSVDGGSTFTNVGLKETQSIGRVVVHPKDPNIVYVAALGHLFGPNPDRGVFKTIDGGKTWNKVKFVNDDTGFTDIVMDPVDPNTLYAASYVRRRVPWGFNGGGKDSGIWKTTDAGKTWTKLEGSGLPADAIIGRIGLDVCRTRPNVVYAQIEVGASGGTGAGVQDNGLPTDPNAPQSFGGGRGGQSPEVQAAQAKVTEAQKQLDSVVKKGEKDPEVVKARAALEAARAEVKKAQAPNPGRSGVWRSDDKGKTWKLMSNNNDRPMYYSQIRVDPNNPDIVYTCGAPFHKSTDGGRTFRTVQGIAHSDHHAFWIDPRNSKHLIIGNDGGLDVSYDQADTWDFINVVAVGQFYAISADMRKPYWVCGGLQDNGSWCGPSATRSTNGVLNSDWFRVGGGDGFYTQQDPSNWGTVYAESQDGAVSRLDLHTGRSVSIRPRGPARAQRPAAGGEVQPNELQQAAAQTGSGGGRGAQPPNVVPTPPEGTQYRFYWNTPILISPHNPAVLYVGGERLFKSLDRGDHWTASPDLTKNISRFDRPILGVEGKAPMASKHDGAAAYSNIITISESPAMPGILWAGTNDGNLQISRDGGSTWKNVVDNVPGLPKETHVSRVEASHFDAGTCYVTFDGHRTDDHRPYVFVTRDYGQTWKSIVANLPPGNVNVIREDPKNKNLLFLGTEYAFYVSLDAGAEWKKFMTGLPTVRIDDILVHPRDNDLIVATHGRSIYIIDDITALQQFSGEVMKTDAHLFDVRPGVAWINDTTRATYVGGQRNFRGENPARGTMISYYLKGAPAGDVKIEISDYTGRVVRTINACTGGLAQGCATKSAGVNRVLWNLAGDLPAAGRGGGAGRGGQAGGGAGRAGAGGQPAAGGQPGAAPPGGQAAGRGAAAGGAASAQGGQYGGGGRGGFGGAALEPGSYLVKLTVGSTTLTTKAVVEGDSLEEK